ncbi:TRAP transporter permease [Cumulibacter manganitolerans]|uniref:TRAP transporter permease n=1 Tax=Cumulibacter manganitolerans TaxID=1884992 RepID=UPI001296EA2A|nr:TRAP transporter fused permease subunit [Cumulibacter manganitolerans]
MTAERPTTPVGARRDEGATGDLATDALAHRDGSTPSVDALIAEYDEEKPQRHLSKRLDQVVTFVTFCVSAFVLWQVFFPQSKGNQYYLIIFLACVLPLVFVLYRFGKRRTTDRTSDGTETAPAPGADTAEGATAEAATEPGAALAVTAEPRGLWRRRRRSDNPGIVDWVLAGLTLLVCVYPLLPFTIGDGGGGFDEFLNRQGILGSVDVVMGFALTILILEATRRTSGIVMPLVCLLFILYAYYGGLLPQTWAISHSGQDWPQIINAFYNDASGFFGTPLDVCATYIVLFTIYGAVLDRTGAGRFFIDVSFAAFRKSRSAPGRTVTLSGFLLGTVSGSGTATAVSLGAVAWPILKRAGYPKENAGGLLAAAGIGAILSPPTLGAAAFIIAEILQVNYLTVLLWATIPTILYYLGIVLAVEIDSRRFGAKSVALPKRSAWQLVKRFGYHFFSLFVIVIFLALDIPPFKAVVYATAVAAVFGLIERLVSKGDPLDPDYVDPASVPAAERPTPIDGLRGYLYDMYHALAAGIRSVLPVAAVCAAAGIITSVIQKTGLGLTLGRMLVDAAQAITSNPTGVLVITVVFAAIGVTVLGLAVPVTASFIISWVIFGATLQGLDISAAEAAMFIFYYAVLSEVSPPTALAAVAASAITGGHAIKTMWQTWKYTLPAFLAPIAFVITDNGSHLLMQGSFIGVVWTTAVSMLAVAALAAVTGGWLYGDATWLERSLCVPAALLLLYLQPLSIGIGLAFLAAAFALNFFRTKRNTPTDPGSTPIHARTTTQEATA